MPSGLSFGLDFRKLYLSLSQQSLQGLTVGGSHGSIFSAAMWSIHLFTCGAIIFLFLL